MKLNIQLDSSSGFLAVRIMKNLKRILGGKGGDHYQRGGIYVRKCIFEVTFAQRSGPDDFFEPGWKHFL